MQELLNNVRRGDLDSRNQLYRILESDQRVQRTVRSLSYEASCVESDDVHAEFWRGVLLGMDIVRHDLGDPVLHLIKRGVWQVKSVVRRELRLKIVQICIACSHINDSYSYRRTCSRCGMSVENLARCVDVADHDFNDEYLSDVASVTAVQVTGKVSPRQRAILDAILACCVSGSTNPQADAARILGISRQRVDQHVKKLRVSLVLTD